MYRTFEAIRVHILAVDESRAMHLIKDPAPAIRLPTSKKCKSEIINVICYYS
jgi:hypothetical protein